MSSPSAHSLTIVSAGIALACGLVVLGIVYTDTPVVQDNDLVFSRDVTAYERYGDVVQYQYKGEKLPEKITPDEDVTKRTSVSFARLRGIEGEGTLDERRTYEGVFYPQPAFIEEGEEWYYVEHATTTETAFEAARTTNPLASLLWKEVHAASVSPFAAAGDGYTLNLYSDSGLCGAARWNTLHDATAGTNVISAGTGLLIDIYSFFDNEIEPFCDMSISRVFLPFDTSSIPVTGTITAATLNVYATGVSAGDNDGTDYLTVVRTSQASHTTLTVSDYDMCGAIDNPTEGIDSGEREDISSMATGAYLTFTLNATGLGWIAKSGQASNCSATNGITCLGIREGHDTSDSQILLNSQNIVTFYASEQTGTAQDPYLSVTYTIPSGSAFWQFQDF